MISFFAGSLVLMKGFEQLVKLGPTVPLAIKLAVCLGFFLPACQVINKHSLFQDKKQHQLLKDLHLNAGQVLTALVTLVFWGFLSLLFFGSGRP